MLKNTWDGHPDHSLAATLHTVSVLVDAVNAHLRMTEGAAQVHAVARFVRGAEDVADVPGA